MSPLTDGPKSLQWAKESTICWLTVYSILHKLKHLGTRPLDKVWRQGWLVQIQTCDFVCRLSIEISF